MADMEFFEIIESCAKEEYEQTKGHGARAWDKTTEANRKTFYNSARRMLMKFWERMETTISGDKNPMRQLCIDMHGNLKKADYEFYKKEKGGKEKKD